MNAFRTGPLSGDDEAQPLGDEHYPGNDEYENEEADGGVDGSPGEGADDLEEA